jgi:purine-binding chemotaxis protein CheW
MSVAELSATKADSDDRQAIQKDQEFLAFRLGSEEYGIPILLTQEIRNFEALTRIANAPEYLKGVMNLRGVIVPVIDMRLRFATGEATFDASTVVIVLNIDGHVIGMIVDSVSDVVTCQPRQSNRRQIWEQRFPQIIWLVWVTLMTV